MNVLLQLQQEQQLKTWIFLIGFDQMQGAKTNLLLDIFTLLNANTQRDVIG